MAEGEVRSPKESKVLSGLAGQGGSGVCITRQRQLSRSTEKKSTKRRERETEKAREKKRPVRPMQESGRRSLLERLCMRRKKEKTQRKHLPSLCCCMYLQ